LFFLRSLQKQVKRLEAKIEKEKMVVVELPEISLRILEHIKQHGRVTMTEMVKITGVSRNTLKTHFRMLTSRKLLTLQGSGRGAWYTLSV
jgi:predicted HTH transcriptional regulator